MQNRGHSFLVKGLITQNSFLCKRGLFYYFGCMNDVLVHMKKKLTKKVVDGLLRHLNGFCLCNSQRVFIENQQKIYVLCPCIK